MTNDTIENKMDPKLKAKWVKALRSDKFKQGAGMLKQYNKRKVEHCCLGVLCEIAGVKKQKRVPGASSVLFDGCSRTYLGQALLNSFGFSDQVQKDLSIHNDGWTYPWSFETIADWIEKNL